MPTRLQTALANRYTLQRELGSGGMATVYLATDLKHNREVAIKVLRPELAAALGPDRFLREIEIAARLRHPHIVPLYDSGEADGFLFYVMPYVRGESLRERLQRERQLPIEDAIRITRETADAISFAHADGIVHRDLKPENIMLEAGHAVVADFGIARAVERAGDHDRITQTGMAVGTPAYMSPEQASGSDEVDGRSDLYSLGCILYEMLAGQPPFTGPTVESLIHQHLAVDPPPVTNLRPAVPAEVIAVLARTLAKVPADRFNPVTQFSEALGRASLSRRTEATAAASPPKRRPPWLALAGTAAVVAIVAFGLSRLVGDGGERDDTKSLAVLPFVAMGGADSEYLGDGIAETLINALAQLEGLKVAARTSAFSFKGTNTDVRTVGHELGVSTVLEGSVQRANDKIRITAQLIDAESGFHLWSKNFDRDADDVFAVQDEVARAVASALRVTLLSDSEAIVDEETNSPAAYDAYLLARFHWNKRTAPDIELATQYFADALAIDSTYARAWAGLAEAYLLYHPSEYEVQSIPWEEAARRGESAARRALALDSTSAQAYTALAAIMEKEKRFAESEQTFRQAIAVNPGYATAHQWYGGLLLAMGRLEDGLHEFRIAAQLDPLSIVINLEVAEALDAIGQTDQATAVIEELLAKHDESGLLHYYAAIHFLIVDKIDRAGRHFEQISGVFGQQPSGDAQLAERIANPESRRESLLAIADTSRRVEQPLAIYRALGEDDQALACLERFLEGPDSAYVYLPAVMMALGPTLSAHPRAQAAFRKFRGE